MLDNAMLPLLFHTRGCNPVNKMLNVQGRPDAKCSFYLFNELFKDYKHRLTD